MFEFIWICEWRNTDVILVPLVWLYEADGAEVSSNACTG